MAASYPTSVKTFTTKSTADIVQAAHVNDLQDEVNAIEAGLLNGTAPLNSSNSTMANLSVTGGSTLGTLNSSNSTLANLSVTGGSTFTGSVTCSTGLTVNGASILGGLRVGSTTVTAQNSTALSIDSTHGLIVWNQSSASTLAGISQVGGNAGGRLVFLMNVGAGALNLLNQSTEAASTSQLLSTGTISITQYQGAGLIYQTLSNRWQVLRIN